MSILIWLIVSSVHCSLDDNAETVPFQMLRTFFNDGSDYDAEFDKRNPEEPRRTPWNPMRAYTYGDWLEKLMKSPVYEK